MHTLKSYYLPNTYQYLSSIHDIYLHIPESTTNNITDIHTYNIRSTSNLESSIPSHPIPFSSSRPNTVHIYPNASSQNSNPPNKRSLPHVPFRLHSHPSPQSKITIQNPKLSGYLRLSSAIFFFIPSTPCIPSLKRRQDSKQQ